MCQVHGAQRAEGGDLLETTAEPGIYLRSARFQRVVDALQKGFFRLLGNAPKRFYRSSGFIPRQDLVRSEYVQKFPQFIAQVLPELGSEKATLMTLPSACLSLYPIVARDGRIPAEGRLSIVSAPCFRNESHYAPERMRAFHMAEFVFFGDADKVADFRATVTQQVQAWVSELEIDARLANASDPFFGRIGEILAERQRAANLKVEVMTPVGEDREVAAFSINDHGDFFCSRWDIRGESGALLRSACVGVGLERLALAMFHRHGRSLKSWPAAFRALL